MKRIKLICFAALALAAAALYAAQDSGLTLRQVRDPVQLRAAVNANALDAETRIAAVESGGAVTNALPAFISATNSIATHGSLLTATTNSVALLQAAAASGLYVVYSTQLVYVASGVTNLLDADITH